MSKFVTIQTELRDLGMIKKALDDLQLAWTPDAIYAHRFSTRREPVAVLVKTPALTFGLREQEGVYDVVGDDMALAAIRTTVKQVTQRYAYHKVLDDAAKAGFDLVEEEVGRDQVIRLTVRRWSTGG